MENELISQPSKTLERVLLSIIRWGSYLSLLAPLIVISSFFYSFVVPKTIFFRIMVEIIFAAYLILILSFPKYRPKINALSVSVFIFVLVSIITSILGADFQRSFWSVFEREAGLFTLFHLYAFFIVLSNVFRSKEDWQKLFLISIVVGVIVCLGVVSASSIAKGGGTIGNTSFLASYLLFDIFFAIALLLENKFSGLGIFAIISLLIFIPIVLSASARAVTVSFFGGLVLIFMGLLFFSNKKILKIIAVIAPIILIGLGLYLFFYIPTIRNFVISNLNTMKARYLVWEMAWKGFLERPVFGWGLENFNVVFAKFFNPKLFLKEYGGEVWFDRTHNIVLDTLINSGIVGLISYLSIFFVSIFSLFKKCFKENREKISVNLTIISLLIAYFVQNLLVFDMISSYVVFFLTLAFIGFLIEEDKFEEDNAPQVFNNKIMRNLVISLIFIFTTTCLYFGNIQPAQSAINTSNMAKAQDLNDQLEFYEKALNTFRYNNEINRFFDTSLITQSMSVQTNQDILIRALDLAQEKTKEDVEKNKLNIRSRFNLSKLYFIRYNLTGDESQLVLAEKTINEILRISPNHPNSYFLLSDIKLRQGDSVAALELIQKAIDLEPRIGLFYQYLFSYYKGEAQYEKAFESIKKAGELGFNWKEKPVIFGEVISLYEKIRDYEEASSLCRELLITYPNDASLWFKLAVYLFNLEDDEGAKEAAQKAVQLDPALNDRAGDTLKILLQ